MRPTASWGSLVISASIVVTLAIGTPMFTAGLGPQGAETSNFWPTTDLTLEATWATARAARDATQDAYNTVWATAYGTDYALTQTAIWLTETPAVMPSAFQAVCPTDTATGLPSCSLTETAESARLTATPTRTPTIVRATLAPPIVVTPSPIHTVQPTATLLPPLQTATAIARAATGTAWGATATVGAALTATAWPGTATAQAATETARPTSTPTATPVPPPPHAEADIRLWIASGLDVTAQVYRSTTTTIAWPAGELLSFSPAVTLTVASSSIPGYTDRARVVAWSFVSSEGQDATNTVDAMGRVGCRTIRDAPAPADGAGLPGCAYLWRTAPQIGVMLGQGNAFWAVGPPLSMCEEAYVYDLDRVRPTDLQIAVKIITERVDSSGNVVSRATRVIPASFTVNLVVPRTTY